MTIAWTLRRAEPVDVAALALIGATTFLETYAGYLQGSDILAHCATRHAPEVYGHWLADTRSAVWLVEAVTGSAPVGYQVVAPATNMAEAGPGDLELVRIYALSRLHGGGAGPAMMAAAVDWSRKVGASRLLVALWEQNYRAMAFYRRAGFQQIGTRHFTVGAMTYVDPVLALNLQPPSGDQTDGGLRVQAVRATTV